MTTSDEPALTAEEIETIEVRRLVISGDFECGHGSAASSAADFLEGDAARLIATVRTMLAERSARQPAQDAADVLHGMRLFADRPADDGYVHLRPSSIRAWADFMERLSADLAAWQVASAYGDPDPETRTPAELAADIAGLVASVGVQAQRAETAERERDEARAEASVARRDALQAVERAQRAEARNVILRGKDELDIPAVLERARRLEREIDDMKSEADPRNWPGVIDRLRRKAAAANKAKDAALARATAAEERVKALETVARPFADAFAAFTREWPDKHVADIPGSLEIRIDGITVGDGRRLVAALPPQADAPNEGTQS